MLTSSSMCTHPTTAILQVGDISKKLAPHTQQRTGKRWYVTGRHTHMRRRGATQQVWSAMIGPERSATFLHLPAPLHRMPHSKRAPPAHPKIYLYICRVALHNHGPTATNHWCNTTSMCGTCRTTCHPLTPSTLAAGRHRSQWDLQAAPSHREPVRPRHPTGHYTTPATCPTRRP